MAEDTYDSMYLWEQVHNTPQQYTKAFKKDGGFAGTAIDPTYLVMRATELWGPIGGEWGYEVVDEGYIQGEPILDLTSTPATVIGHITIHKIRLHLSYPVTGPNGERGLGHVEQYGQTTFIGRNKNGLFTDEEHAKKSLTDALSKCLSLLGFGADVRIGKFEDSSYAQMQEGKEKGGTPPPTTGITEDQKKEIVETLKVMKRNWTALATVCSTQLKREIKEMDDLTSEEAVKALAFLQGKVAK